VPEKVIDGKKKIGSPFKVTADGWCKDRIGRLDSFAPDAPKPFGLIITGVKGTVWFKPDEIEEV